MNFTVSIFAKPVIAERRHVEFCCTDFHTDNKEIQNTDRNSLRHEAKHGSQCADFDENRA